jgi:hypothetical protein
MHPAPERRLLARVQARLRRYRVFWYLLLALAAVDLLVAHFADLWLSYDPDPYRDRLHACREHAWDLVAVGASPVSFGIDPEMLAGLRWHGQSLDRVFNLGLILATSSEVYQAVKHGLPQPPRLLVYGITASDINDDRHEPHGPRNLMGLGDMVQFSRCRPDLALWCFRHALDERVQGVWKLYYYRNGIRAWAEEQARNLREGKGLANLLTPHVQVEVFNKNRLDKLRARGKITDEFPFLEHFRVGGYVKDVHRLLDWGEQHGVSVVLVDMPVPAHLDERLYPREFAAYRAVLAELERSRGVRVLRPTRAVVGLTDADFADMVHLNGYGKERLSTWLRRALSDLSMTDDHRVVNASGFR